MAVTDLVLKRVILKENRDCDGCGCPLFPGEVAWEHEDTFSTGCCQPCARDAAVAKLALFDGSLPCEAQS